MASQFKVSLLHMK